MMRSSFERSLFGGSWLPSRRHLLLGALGLAASGSFNAVLAARTAPKQLGEGCYVLTGVNSLMTTENSGAICNIGIVWGDDSAMLIDSGGSAADANEIASAVAKLTDRPLRHVVNTHMHPDHLFGNGTFKKSGSQIIGHANLAEALAARREAYLTTFTRELGPGLMKDVEFISPDVVVDSTLQIDLGNRLIELRAWKTAHTNCDLTAYDRASATIFAGDLVFSRHIPTMDGSLAGWLAQLEELAAIPARQCVPGHGPAPSPWPAVIDEERRYFEQLQADIRKAIDAGVPIGEAATQAAASERSRWELFDEFNERNAAAVYTELEWE